jgi:Family of unknown function (DUF6788)
MSARTQRSISERDARSRAAQLLANEPFLRGSLTLRYRTCGRSYCRCQKGQKHPGLYLHIRDGDRWIHTYIPKALHDTARQWVENGQRIKRLVDRVSQHNLQALLERKEPLLTRKGRSKAEGCSP